MTAKTLKLKLPDITSFPDVATLFALAEGNEVPEGWLLSNFFHLEAPAPDTLRENYFSMNFLYSYLFLDECPFLTVDKIDKKFVQLKWASFAEFAIDMIDMDYYLYLYLDLYFIPPAEGLFERSHLSHKALVFGYDKDARTLRLGDFFRERGYSFEEVSFSQVEPAFSSEPSASMKARHDIHQVKLIRAGVDSPYKLDYALVAENIYCYRNALNPRERNRLGHYQTDRQYCVYGIDVYESLAEYVRLQASGSAVHNIYSQREQAFFDLRPFKVLRDHKSVLQRLVVALQREDLSWVDYPVIAEKVAEVVGIAERLLLVGIKFRLTGDLRNLATLSGLIGELRDAELPILTALYEKFSKLKSHVYYQKRIE